jgi:anti-sigma factor RsiW
MMSCREMVDFLADYLDGNLPADQLETFEKHLNKCEPCEHYLDTYKDCIRIARECMCDQTECEEPPAELMQAILKARKSSCDS